MSCMLIACSVHVECAWRCCVLCGVLVLGAASGVVARFLGLHNPLALRLYFGPDLKDCYTVLFTVTHYPRKDPPCLNSQAYTKRISSGTLLFTSSWAVADTSPRLRD